MYCRKCGSEIPDNAKFCTKCGAKIENNRANAVKNTNTLDIDLDSEFDFMTDDIDMSVNDNETIEKKKQSIFVKVKEILAKKSEEKKDKKTKTKSKTKKKKPAKKATKKSKKKISKKSSKKVVKKKVAKKSKKEKKPKKLKAKNIDKKKKTFRLPFMKKKSNDELDVELPKKKSSKIKLIIIILAVLVLLASAAIFAYMRFGDDFFADVNAKKALLRSSEEFFTKYDDKYIFPNDYLSDDDGFIHRKYKFKINDAYGGLINEDVLSTLEGISIEMDSTRALIGNDAYQIISVKNKKNDELRFELENNESNFKVKLADFYKNSLVVSHQLEEGKVFSSAHDEIIAKRDLWFYSVKAFDDVKYSFNSPFVDFINTSIESITFNIKDKNEEGKVLSYSAILDDAVLLDTLKVFLSELDSDADVKTIMNDIRYFAAQNKALKKTSLSSANIIQDYIASIDSAISSEAVSDIEIVLNMAGDGNIENIELNTRVSNLDTSLLIYMNDEESKQGLRMNLIFSRDDSEIKIEYNRDSSIIGQEETHTYEKNDNYILSTKYKDIVTKFELVGEQTYEPKTGIYEKIYKFNSGDFFDRLRLTYKENGKYEFEETKKKFEKDIEIDYDTIFYDYNIKFVGSIIKNKVESIGSMNISDEENLDYISNEDYDIVKKEISDSIDIFLKKFSTGEW